MSRRRHQKKLGYLADPPPRKRREHQQGTARVLETLDRLNVERGEPLAVDLLVSSDKRRLTDHPSLERTSPQ